MSSASIPAPVIAEKSAAAKAVSPRTPRPAAKQLTPPEAKPAKRAAPKEPVKPVGRKATAKAPTAPRSSAVKPASPKAAVPASPPPALEKPAKAPKVRLVRDSFTMPEADFALVATLKERALKNGRAAKKSELLRAGLQLLGQQSPAALVAALERLQPIKTGRPKRSD